MLMFSISVSQVAGNIIQRRAFMCVLVRGIKAVGGGSVRTLSCLHLYAGERQWRGRLPIAPNTPVQIDFCDGDPLDVPKPKLLMLNLLGSKGTESWPNSNE